MDEIKGAMASLSEVNMKGALGFGLTALATEHFFTAFLSSPKASEKFLNPADVQEMFYWATLTSLGFAVAMCLFLRNLWSLLSSLLLVFLFYIVYKPAMEVKA